MRASSVATAVFLAASISICRPAQATAPSVVVANLQRYCVETRGGIGSESAQLVQNGWYDVGDAFPSVLPSAIFSDRVVLANRSPAFGAGVQFVSSGVRTEPYMVRSQAMNIHMCVVGGDETHEVMTQALEDWLGPIQVGSPTWIYLPKDARGWNDARVVSEPEAERLGALGGGSTVLGVTLLQNGGSGIMTTTISPRR